MPVQQQLEYSIICFTNVPKSDLYILSDGSAADGTDNVEPALLLTATTKLSTIGMPPLAPDAALSTLNALPLLKPSTGCVLTMTGLR